MKKVYHKIEAAFEKFAESSLKIFGNSITFLIAACLVIIWITDTGFSNLDRHDKIRDIFLGITFLSFFIIQKTVNKYSKAMHIKLNELVSAHEAASDELVNIEQKTEAELEELNEKFKKG